MSLLLFLSPQYREVRKNEKIYSSKLPNAKTTIYEVQEEWTTKMIICKITQKDKYIV
ncbi:MAG TPA: hypothetical protein VFR94_18495 [Nitrososphaeraceae archaeon]|nr:hypothetical protein [Nitrososphaeraceae archaeon]